MKMKRIRKRKFFACVSCSILALAGSGALAQDEVEADDVIVVTGIKKSLQDAASVKRNSDTFVDSIVAEDVSKLADENVAEALSRVTGVQVRRGSGGEGDQVDIRGSALNRISINGRTLPAFQGRQSGRSDRDNGEINILGIIPSELIGRLDVTKLPSADQVEGSIGGNVDIVTRRALDSEGPTLVASAQAIYTDLAEDIGYKGAVVGSTTFADDTFGVLVGLTYNKRSLREDRFFSFSGYQDRSAAFGDVNGRPVFGIAGLRYQQLESERETFSVNGSFDFVPNDQLNLYADVLYSVTNIDEARNWTQINLPGDPSDYSDFTVSENGTIVAGTFQNLFRGNTNANPNNKFNALSFAIGGDYEATDRLSISSEFSYSQTELNRAQNFVLNRTTDVFDATYDFGAGDIPSLVVTPSAGSTQSITDINSFEFITYFNNRQFLQADDLAGRIDFEYKIDAGILESVEIGGRIQNLSQDTRAFEEFAFPSPRPLLSDPTFSPFGASVTREDLLSGTGVEFPRAGIVADPLAFGLDVCDSGVFGAGFTFGDDPQCTGPTLSDLSSFTIDETSYAGYSKFNFSGDLGAVPFSAQGGVRVVSTNVTVNGSQNVDSGMGPVIQPSVAENNYRDVLPSGAIKFDLTDEIVIRAGGAKVVRRPESSDLNTGFSVVLLGGIGGRTTNTGSGGNPFLLPFRATSFDVSLEWYDDTGTVLTIGGFHKDVKSFVTSVTDLRTDIPGFVGTDILFTQPVNGDGASISGVEVAGHLPFFFLAEPFDGLGLQANYTFVDSSIESGGTLDAIDIRTGETLPFPGISKNSYNIIGYYEKGPFSVRLAYNWRDQFLERIVNGTGVFFDTFSTVNASLRYAINDNFSIDIEGTNLTRSAQSQFAGFEDSLLSYAVSDRRIFVGARFRY